MRNAMKCSLVSAVVMAASMSTAFAQIPLGTRLGLPMPFGNGGILGLAALGVIGGVWLARRKR